MHRHDHNELSLRDRESEGALSRTPSLTLFLLLPSSYSLHMHSISRNWKLGNGKNVAWESGAQAQAAEAEAGGDVSGDG